MKYTSILNGSFVEKLLNDEATKIVLNQQDRGEKLPKNQQAMNKYCMEVRNKLQIKFEQQN